jgi:hypothetical protein
MFVDVFVDVFIEVFDDVFDVDPISQSCFLKEKK